MNLTTLLTEAAIKGAERRAEYRLACYTVCAYVHKITPKDKIILEGSYDDCTAFIEREGLRASMAYVAEHYEQCGITGGWKLDIVEPVTAFKAISGGGEDYVSISGLLSDEAVEAASRQLYSSYMLDDDGVWDDVGENERNIYRQFTKAAMLAAIERAK